MIAGSKTRGIAVERRGRHAVILGGMASDQGRAEDGALADREPTSHERRHSQSWDASYTGEDSAPWDIGRPQAGFQRLAEEGRWSGAVLDSGCGTGEHALLAASQGLEVLGIDVAETAIAMAREKAARPRPRRRVPRRRRAPPGGLGRTFDTVLDCGLFHTFDGEEQRAYVASLAAVDRARRDPLRPLLQRRRPEPPARTRWPRRSSAPRSRRSTAGASPRSWCPGSK